MQKTSQDEKLRSVAKKVLEMRRDLEPHKFFVPNSFQKRILTSSIKERWAFCGNGIGKTVMLCIQGVFHLTGEYPDWFPAALRCKIPSRGGMSTTTFTNAMEKGLIEELKNWCPGGVGKKKRDRFHWDSRMKRMTDKKTGSVLDLFSYDQDPKDWAGPSKDYWLWDEHGTHKHYQEAKRSLRGFPGIFCAGLTPTEGMSWEFDVIYDRADDTNLSVFRGNTLENSANLPDDYEDTLTSGLNEEEKRMRLEGEFIELSGLVYPQFNHSVHVCDAFDVFSGEAANWPKYMAIDPGYRNPCGAVWATVDPDGQLYFYREYYEAKRTIPENARFIAEAMDEREALIYALIDPIVRGHDLSNHQTQLEQWEDAFVAIGKTWPIYPGDNDVDAGIEAVRGRLVDRTIHFFPDMINTFKEFRRYVHQSHRYKSVRELNSKEKPKSFMDHLLDCCRYMIMDDPQFFRLDDKSKVDTIGGIDQMSGRTGY
jgi:hypothetical protein